MAGVPAALAAATVQAAIRAAAGSTISGAFAAAVSTVSERMLMPMVLTNMKPAVVVVLAVLTTATIVPGFLAASDRPPASSATNGSGPKAVDPGVAEGRPGRESGQAVDKHDVKAEAIALAAKAFGSEHWSADPDLPGRYYNKGRGYWMYYKEYERRNDGKQYLFKPFAARSLSRAKRRSSRRSRPTRRYLTSTGHWSCRSISRGRPPCGSSKS